jgi:hypothetical protein
LFFDELRRLIDNVGEIQAFVVFAIPLDLVFHLGLLFSEPHQLLLYILVLLIFKQILVCIDHWLESKALAGLNKALRLFIVRDPVQREYENLREFGDPGLLKDLLPRLPNLRTKVDRSCGCRIVDIVAFDNLEHGGGPSLI